jgi:hypothetical protein
MVGHLGVRMEDGDTREGRRGSKRRKGRQERKETQDGKAEKEGEKKRHEGKYIARNEGKMGKERRKRRG